MAFVLKFIKGCRNHWKKTTFAAFAIAYGTNYFKEYNEACKLMRVYCLESKKYGDKSIQVHEQLKKITVIINPNANRRKAMKQFEKYCAPILNLAGICVDVIQTHSEGHAKSLIEELKQTDAIVIAGGDGTVSEVVTGLLRRSTDDRQLNPCPLGILPLGRTNTVAKLLFPGGDSLQIVRSLADASLAIVREHTKTMDVMKIEIIDETTRKPVYAVSSLEWGVYRDAYAKRDKYWYFGSFRKYMTYLFNGSKNNASDVDINYTVPCDGCSNCYVKPLDSFKKRWWHSFVSRPKVQVDYSKIINDECSKRHEKDIMTSDLTLATANILDSHKSELNLKYGPYTIPYFDFIAQGWQNENGKDRNVTETIKVKQIEIVPKVVSSNEDLFFSIDKEDYEVKPIRVTLLPKVLKVFCKYDM